VKENRVTPATPLSLPPYPLVGLCCALVLISLSNPQRDSIRRRRTRREARRREGFTRPPSTSAKRGLSSLARVRHHRRAQRGEHRPRFARLPTTGARRGLPSLARGRLHRRAHRGGHRHRRASRDATSGVVRQAAAVELEEARRRRRQATASEREERTSVPSAGTSPVPLTSTQRGDWRALAPLSSSRRELRVLRQATADEREERPSLRRAAPEKHAVGRAQQPSSSRKKLSPPKMLNGHGNSHGYGPAPCRRPTHARAHAAVHSTHPPLPPWGYRRPRWPFVGVVVWFAVQVEAREGMGPQD
jgi:hypothetical protein